MKKKTVGFFKKVQGVFTEEVIENIKERLRQEADLELVEKDLDFSRAYVLGGNVYIDDFNLNELDLYFWHDTVYPTDWRGDNYFINVFKALEQDCLIINSPASIERVNDKYLSHLALRAEGLPVADFGLVNLNNRAALKNVFEALGGEVLIKPRFGGWGRGIVKTDSLEDLYSTAELLSGFLVKDDQILLERFYPNDEQKWISVVLFGRKVLFGYHKRSLGESAWKIYDPEKKDGKGLYSEYVEVPESLKEIALSAQRVIGKDIICFDFIYTAEGYKIVDENGRPGLYAKCLEAAHIDIEEEVVGLILSKLKDDEK